MSFKIKDSNTLIEQSSGLAIVYHIANIIKVKAARILQIDGITMYCGSDCIVCER